MVAELDDDERQRRLKELEARISALKDEPEAKSHTDEHYSQAHLAWRMVIELVAGIAIGFGIGFGLDTLFGTMPLFLVLFILLGLAAGIRTMLRSAQEIAKAAPDGSAQDEEEPSGH